MTRPKKWIRRWNSWVAPQPVQRGVWLEKDGGFLVRGQTIDPTTGQVKEVRAVLRNVGPAAARQWLDEQLDLIRRGTAPREAVTFRHFAEGLLQRKLDEGDIRSQKGREKWEGILVHLNRAFGKMHVDQIRYQHIEDWRSELGRRIRAGKLAPSTANDRIAVLKVIMKAAKRRYELERNPAEDVPLFSRSLRPTYTEEQPNSLTVEEVPRFLAMMEQLYPQHYAMVALGFATGWRPSSLRPLRRKGPTPDVLWSEGIILVRRSHTRKQTVMESTKTGIRQRIRLPDELMEILRQHVARLEADAELGLREKLMAESDLLFPARHGGLRTPSCLDKPFAHVCQVLGLTKVVTPRAMRRTFQDLARAAEVADIVTRAVSGHATETMQRHYSTVADREVQEGIARIHALATGQPSSSDSADGDRTHAPLADEHGSEGER